MKRVLSILLLLFARTWSMRFMAGAALFFLVVGMFSGPDRVTSSFFLIILIMWSSDGFREVISNPRLSMLPWFRAHAVAVVVLVAATVGCATAIAAASAPGPFFVRGAVNAGLLAFSMVSVYFLLSQWFATFQAPILPRLLLLMLVARYVFTGELYEGTPALTESAWAFAVLALLGWLWLLVALQTTAQPRGPSPSLRIEYQSGINARSPLTLRSVLGVDFINLGPPAHATGTLVRNANNGWINRIGASALWVLGFALVWFLSVQWNPDPAGHQRNVDTISSFLFLSFSVTVVRTWTQTIDWPARLRHVWLRSPGNRTALWRSLDRMVWEEAGIVAGITGTAALGISFATNTAVWLLLAYTAGSTLAMLLGAYFVMALRTSGSRVADVNWYNLLVWCPVIMVIVFVGQEPGVLTSLIIMFGVFAWICRRHVRRQVMRMDWCAVKPAPNFEARRRST